jgi:methanogen homoaconitase large subunit
MVLQLAGLLGAAGARYMAVEFDLPASVPLPARMTLCGMTTEIGAKAGMVIPDAVTAAYARVPDWLYPDPDAVYVQREAVDLGSLEPLVAEPGHVDRVVPVSATRDVTVDVVFLGTCTNGRLADLHAAAEILRGHRVHPGTRMMVVPASHEVLREAAADGTLMALLDAGATLGTPGCGPCMGRHMGVLAAGEVCLSTGNRNFAGRMGSPEARIYLGSPEVAAATAIAGRIAAPAEVL